LSLVQWRSNRSTTVAFKLLDRDGGARKSKSCCQLEAEELILDAVGKIDAVRQSANLRFEDVRRGCSRQRLVPTPFPEQERGLFLGAGDRDPKVLVLTKPKGSRCKVAEKPGYFLVVNRSAVDSAGGAGFDAVRQELQCADTVPSDSGK